MRGSRKPIERDGKELNQGKCVESEVAGIIFGSIRNSFQFNPEIITFKGGFRHNFNNHLIMHDAFGRCQTRLELHVLM